MSGFSPARAQTGGGLAAVARLHQIFAALLTGEGRHGLIASQAATDEICMLGLFSIVAAVVAPGDQLKGERIKMFLDADAEASSLFQASSSAPVALALIESWRMMTRMAATRPKESGICGDQRRCAK